MNYEAMTYEPAEEYYSTVTYQKLVMFAFIPELLDTIYQRLEAEEGSEEELELYEYILDVTPARHDIVVETLKYLPYYIVSKVLKEYRPIIKIFLKDCWRTYKGKLTWKQYKPMLYDVLLDYRGYCSLEEEYKPENYGLNTFPNLPISKIDIEEYLIVDEVIEELKKTCRAGVM
jgi:hypothetical protein